MTRTVLLALDGSEHSLRALKWYADNAQLPGDCLLIVFVVEPPSIASTAGAASPDFYLRFKEEALTRGRQLAQQVTDLCAQWGVRPETTRFLERMHSRPGPTLVEVAREEAADLIVLGSRGVSGLRRALLGSVSDYVLHHAHRPTIIVPPPALTPQAPTTVMTKVVIDNIVMTAPAAAAAAAVAVASTSATVPK